MKKNLKKNEKNGWTYSSGLTLILDGLFRVLLGSFDVVHGLLHVVLDPVNQFTLKFQKTTLNFKFANFNLELFENSTLRW